MSYELAELQRQINNLLRIGTICDVDHSSRKLKVKTGELITGWLDWPAEIGKNYTRWRPLRINTQVLIGCPAGDPAQGQIIGMLYSDALSSPSTSDAIDVIEFDDGSFIKHDAGSGSMHIHAAGNLNLTAGGAFNLTAPGVVKMTGSRVELN